MCESSPLLVACPVQMPHHSLAMNAVKLSEIAALCQGSRRRIECYSCWALQNKNDARELSGCLPQIGPAVVWLLPLAD